jgi:hypothetical protein
MALSLLQQGHAAERRDVASPFLSSGQSSRFGQPTPLVGALPSGMAGSASVASILLYVRVFRCKFVTAFTVRNLPDPTPRLEPKMLAASDNL